MTRKTEPLVEVEEVRRRAKNAADPQRCGLTDEMIREFMATLSDDPGEDGLIRANCLQALEPKPRGLTVLWYAAHVSVEAAMRKRTTRTSRPHIRVPGERTAQLPPEAIPTLQPVGLATVPDLTPLPLPPPPATVAALHAHFEPPELDAYDLETRRLSAARGAALVAACGPLSR